MVLETTIMNVSNARGDVLAPPQRAMPEWAIQAVGIRSIGSSQCHRLGGLAGREAALGSTRQDLRAGP